MQFFKNIKHVWNAPTKKVTLPSVCENEKRLKNILFFANSLVNNNDSAITKDRQSIFYLIKMLTDKIMLESAQKLIESGDERLALDRIFIEQSCILNGPKELHKALEPKTDLDVIVKIHLATDAILPFPWNTKRLSSNLSTIGTSENPWREQYDHYLNLWLPLGVCFIAENGNHSVFTGVIKRQGTVKIYPSSKHYVTDISPLYPYVIFDGEYYRWKESGKIIQPANNFEFGCIYEIGRIIWSKGIKFKEA